MIACMCAGISDGAIREAIRGGASSLDEIASQVRGAGADCGSCRAFLKHLLDVETRERQMDAQTSPEATRVA